MRIFFATYQNEWSKLIARKKYIVFLCIGLGLCIIWTGLGQLIASVAMQQSGFSLTLTPTPLGTLPFYLQFMIPFLMFMGVTDLITVEAVDNNMKAMIYRPVERWKLYASKILVVVTYAALYLACVFVLSTLLNQILGRPLRASELFVALVSYAMTLIPLAILASFAALIALLGRSGTLTMFLLLLAYFLLSALPVFFPLFNEMLFTSYLSWYTLWIGVLPSASKMIHMLAIVFGYGIVFFTAGSLVFERKEF